MNEKSS